MAFKCLPSILHSLPFLAYIVLAQNTSQTIPSFNPQLVFLFPKTRMECISRTNNSDVLQQLLDTKATIRQPLNTAPSCPGGEFPLLKPYTAENNSANVSEAAFQLDQWIYVCEADNRGFQGTIVRKGIPPAKIQNVTEECGKLYYMPMTNNFSSTNELSTASGRGLNGWNIGSNNGAGVTGQFYGINGTQACELNSQVAVDILPSWNTCTKIQGRASNTSDDMYVISDHNQENGTAIRVCSNPFCTSDCVNMIALQRPASLVESSPQECVNDNLLTFYWPMPVPTTAVPPSRPSFTPNPPSNNVTPNDRIALFGAVALFVTGMFSFFICSSYKRSIQFADFTREEILSMPTAWLTPEQRQLRLEMGFKASHVLPDESPTFMRQGPDSPIKKPASGSGLV